MSNRLTKIYTRQGDAGYTTFRNQRLSKDDALIETLGTLDELNAAIGWITTLGSKNVTVTHCLHQIQQNLFNLGGELHTPQHIIITAEKVKELEQQLDEWNETLPPLKEFILPGGNPLSAACHIARTVCRRAERCLVRLHRQAPINNTEMLRYLNRLSDLLFVMSRILARETNEKELLWERN